MIVFTVEYSPFSVDSLLIGDNEPSSPSPSEPSFFTPLPVPNMREEGREKRRKKKVDSNLMLDARVQVIVYSFTHHYYCFH